MNFKFHEDCNKCVLDKIKVVWGKGNINSKIMLIGRDPGRNEVKQGIPFVGRSGKYLRKVLNEEKIPIKKTYITNIVKCRPPNNRRPAQKTINYCKKFLVNEIKTVKPHVIMPLGKLSSSWFIKNIRSITKYVGRVFKMNNENYLIPNFHPAYILRNKNTKIEKKFRSTIKKILKYMNKKNSKLKI